DRRNIEEIHTFEHQQTWYDKYKDIYSGRVKCYLIGLDKGYTQAGNMFGPNYFDLAFIDGRGRVKCMETAKILVKKGGLVMLHDSERGRYKEGTKLFSAIKEVNGTLLMKNDK
ncbi:unnamed protein product, partial [marine sediment metagenome]